VGATGGQNARPMGWKVCEAGKGSIKTKPEVHRQNAAGSERRSNRSRKTKREREKNPPPQSARKRWRRLRKASEKGAKPEEGSAEHLLRGSPLRKKAFATKRGCGGLRVFDKRGVPRLTHDDRHSVPPPSPQ